MFDEQGNQIREEQISRFVLFQDTGGAIRGPHRIDLFCGSGRQNEYVAGHLKNNGKLYLLVKKKQGE